jgi:cytidylate kinase
MANRLRIAIDGPAAAGKSTVARNVAKKLSIVYVDTGAMYRALTLKALNNHIEMDDETLINLLTSTTIQLKQHDSGQIVLLDGENVSEAIRTTVVTNHVSQVAKHRQVREEMVQRQREMGNNISVIMDGRDIGTHVLPDAEIKIYLIASPKKRAQRRHQENLSIGYPSDLAALEEEIAERDQRDMNREVAPLVQAKDAILIDTSDLSIGEVEEKILDLVKKYQQKVENKKNK